jgi:cyclopropane fatty-acyl-phospholipid synthase-like methyltransferase
MELNNRQAKQYFNKVPEQWDALYSHENRLKYTINKWLRKGLFERYRLTFEHCGNLAGAKVLDIGCGSGRFSLECTKRGAAHVVGIDFAPSMIKYSQNVAKQMGVADKCEFICDDFLSYQFDEQFDIVLALGLFDYVPEPEPLFSKIAAMHPRKFLASFPKFTLIWGIQRHIRYNLIRKCPIYNYTRTQLDRLFSEAPFEQYEIIGNSRGFFGAGGAA